MKRKIFLILTITLLIASTQAVFADWQKGENNRYKYFNSATGQYVVNNWIQTGNGFYYFDAYGYAVTGWYQINGKYYYFDENGLMRTGFQEFNNKKYYLNPSNGQMVTGWIQTYTDGVIDYYYFANDGSMLTGWNKLDNDWYYFYDGKCLIDTFAAVNGIWYHFNERGAMDTGWVSSNGKMFYFNSSDGSLTKGWIQDYSGNEYYLSEVDGSLAVNTTLQIGGMSYTFDSQGKCISKEQNYSASNANSVGVLGNKGREVVAGVNIGVEPGSNGNANGITSYQYNQQQQQSLQSGSTSGPR